MEAAVKAKEEDLLAQFEEEKKQLLAEAEVQKKNLLVLLHEDMKQASADMMARVDRKAQELMPDV